MNRTDLEKKIAELGEAWMKVRSPFVQGLSEDEQIEILAAHILESLIPEMESNREFAKELFTMAIEKMVYEELEEMEREKQQDRE